MKVLDLDPKGWSPFRRIFDVFVGTDPRTGEPVALPTQAEIHTISPDGSPDTVRYHVPQTRDCLHPVEAPFGGACYECRSQSCAQCHGMCHECQKPICVECSRFRESPKGRVRLCHRCQGILRRRHTAKAVGWFLVSPFVKRRSSEEN